MKDRKKLFGIIGLSVSAVVSTIVTTWMTDREISKKVDEAIEQKSKDEES